MTADARQLTPTQRLHEVTMQALAPAPRSGQDNIEVGQEARTGRWYVKSLTVYRGDDEGWSPWVQRVAALAAEATRQLPPPPGDADGQTVAGQPVKAGAVVAGVPVRGTVEP